MLIALRVFAGLYGLMALAGSVVLALFFTLETSMFGRTPRGDFFGPLSDWGGVFGSVPLVLAVLLFAYVARARWWFWALTALVVISTIVFAAVSWNFIEGRMTLGDQFAAAGPQIALLVAWMVSAGVTGARAGVLPRWMRAFAFVLVAAIAVCATIFGISFAVPPAGGWRTILTLAGAIPGFLAWTAIPVWWICVAVTARKRIEHD
ncbi:MAG: hypothetical protein ABWY55_08925 [Microbacterium sp.]